jgi:hypothetical protein
VKWKGVLRTWLKTHMGRKRGEEEFFMRVGKKVQLFRNRDV